jgi:putative transcriptional regulator
MYDHARQALPVKNALRAPRYLAAALLLVLLPVSSQTIPAAAAAATAKPATPSAAASRNALTSILIVAQDPVSDPNFGGSIVVVMNNLGPAPVGVIINRPMPLTVARFFPKLKRLAQVHDKVYFGGPVEFGTVWYLFRAKTAPATAIRVCGGVYVSSDDKLLLKLLGRPNPMQGLRLFLGHAGWYPGQLQMEIQGGAWRPKRADADSIFNPEPKLPWPSAAPGPKRGT